MAESCRMLSKVKSVAAVSQVDKKLADCRCPTVLCRRAGTELTDAKTKEIIIIIIISGFGI